MITIQEKIIGPELLKEKNNLILTGDIGGTNCNFALMTATLPHPEMALYLHLDSREVTDFSAVMKQVADLLQEKYSIKIADSCLAIAGPISTDRQEAKMTNLTWKVNCQDIKKITGISTILINDFQAIGFGLESLPKDKLILLKSGTILPQEPKGIIGAGTGLGKCLLLWNKDQKRYFPFSSEGGHADFPAQSQDEWKMVEFIKKKNQQARVSWQNLVSGKGLSHIYQYLLETSPATSKSAEIKSSNYDPALISKYHQEDKLCQKTFQKFVQLYARAAKDYALETMAMGGVYLAGGIVTKNLAEFQQEIFKSEFITNPKLSDLLQSIPVWAINDYQIGLYGAAVAALTAGMRIAP